LNAIRDRGSTFSSYLPGGAIQFPGGSFFPAVDQRLFTAHRKIPITLKILNERNRLVSSTVHGRPGGL
ncbi:MAG: hypothetical protein WCA27_14170, partial [Candidatus Sulfotelmatobacter sp.]